MGTDTKKEKQKLSKLASEGNDNYAAHIGLLSEVFENNLKLVQAVLCLANRIQNKKNNKVPSKKNDELTELAKVYEEINFIIKFETRRQWQVALNAAKSDIKNKNKNIETQVIEKQFNMLRDAINSEDSDASEQYSNILITKKAAKEICRKKWEMEEAIEVDEQYIQFKFNLYKFEIYKAVADIINKEKFPLLHEAYAFLLDRLATKIEFLKLNEPALDKIADAKKIQDLHLKEVERYQKTNSELWQIEQLLLCLFTKPLQIDPLKIEVFCDQFFKEAKAFEKLKTTIKKLRLNFATLNDAEMKKFKELNAQLKQDYENIEKSSKEQLLFQLIKVLGIVSENNMPMRKEKRLNENNIDSHTIKAKKRVTAPKSISAPTSSKLPRKESLKADDRTKNRTKHYSRANSSPNTSPTKKVYSMEPSNAPRVNLSHPGNTIPKLDAPKIFIASPLSARSLTFSNPFNGSFFTSISPRPQTGNEQKKKRAKKL